MSTGVQHLRSRAVLFAAIAATVALFACGGHVASSSTPAGDDASAAADSGAPLGDAGPEQALCAALRSYNAKCGLGDRCYISWQDRCASEHWAQAFGVAYANLLAGCWAGSAPCDPLGPAHAKDAFTCTESGLGPLPLTDTQRAFAWKTCGSSSPPCEADFLKTATGALIHKASDDLTTRVDSACLDPLVKSGTCPGLNCEPGLYSCAARIAGAALDWEDAFDEVCPMPDGG